jgi:hypothetical protein
MSPAVRDEHRNIPISWIAGNSEVIPNQRFAELTPP